MFRLQPFFGDIEEDIYYLIEDEQYSSLLPYSSTEEDIKRYFFPSVECPYIRDNLIVSDENLNKILFKYKHVYVYLTFEEITLNNVEFEIEIFKDCVKAREYYDKN